jgi:hypothetical protein
MCHRVHEPDQSGLSLPRERARVRSRRCLAAALIIIAAVGLGCSSGGNEAAPVPKCEKPPEGIGPDADATLQDGDAGRTVCLKQGDVLTVFLHAPVNEERWRQITTADHAVLAPRSSGVLTLPLGVTAAVFAATGKGTARLESTRPPCSPPATSGCDASHRWSARVVVR